MRSYGDATRLVSKIVFAGLLISLLPVTLLVRAQQVPVTEIVMQQMTSSMKPKLSKEEIDKRIRIIKKTVDILKIANIVVPLLIAGAGAAVFFGALIAVIGPIRYLVSLLPGKEGLVTWGQELFSTIIHQKPIVEPKQIRPLIVSLTVMIITFIVTPIATALSTLGLTGITLSTAFVMAHELEQMARNQQITLTADQKRVLVQLKNMARLPITRGLVKYFALKKILNNVVKNAMENNPELVTKVAPGKPKKAHKIIAQYIKLKWTRENIKKAIAQLAQETTPHLQRAHKKAVAQLQKIEQKLTKLDAQHVILGVSRDVKSAVQEFRAKADRILEELKKPVLEKKKPRPMAVPL